MSAKPKIDCQHSFQVICCLKPPALEVRLFSLVCCAISLEPFKVWELRFIRHHWTFVSVLLTVHTSYSTWWLKIKHARKTYLRANGCTCTNITRRWPNYKYNDWLFSPACLAVGLYVSRFFSPFQFLLYRTVMT